MKNSMGAKMAQLLVVLHQIVKGGQERKEHFGAWNRSV